MTESRLDPDKIYNITLSAGDDWADKNAAAHSMEEMKKTVLAQQSLVYIKEGLSVSKSEVMALCSDEYINHIRDMVEARKLANKARVKLDLLKVLAEMRRTLEVTRRAEIQLM